MSDIGGEVGSLPSASSASISRRTALKAGVGAGVGLAAWSGSSITSLGGTPAYALGCTFAVEIDLIPCRNTDQGTSQCLAGPPIATHRFHVLKDTGLPTGYALLNNLTEGTCCNEVSNPILQHPADVACTIELLFAGPSNCTGTPLTGYPADIGVVLNGTQVEIGLNGRCPDPLPSNTQYSLIARCVTPGLEDCFA